MATYEEVYKNICRLCLSHDKSESMVSLINDLNNLSHYGEAVLKFANISIKPDDNLPSKMCRRCLYLLKQTIYFKFNCEHIDKQLKTLTNISSETFKETVVQYSMYRFYFPTETVNNLHMISSNKELPNNPHNTNCCVEKTVLETKSKDMSNIDSKQNLNKSDINCVNESTFCKALENSFIANNGSETQCDQNPYIESEVELSNLQNEDIILDVLEKMIGTHSEALNSDVKHSKQRRFLRRRKFLKLRHQIDTKHRLNDNRLKKTKKSLVCKVCRKILANQHTYEHHMQRHNGCRFICEHCGKGFPVRAELKIHQVARHGTGPFLQCQQCSFKAPRNFDLIEHERIHTGERPYTCDKCGLTFRRRGIWKKHLIYHMEKKVQCTQCPRKFYQRSEMLAHANNVHDRLYVYLCSKCGVTYAKPATVRRHLTERHGIPREMQGKVIRVNKGSGCHEQ